MELEKLVLIVLNIIALMSSLLTISAGVKQFYLKNTISIIEVLNKIKNAKPSHQILLDYHSYFKMKNIKIDVYKVEIYIYKNQKRRNGILLFVILFSILVFISFIGIFTKPLTDLGSIYPMLIVILLAYIGSTRVFIGILSECIILNIEKRTFKEKSSFGKSTEYYIDDLTSVKQENGGIKLVVENLEISLITGLKEIEIEIWNSFIKTFRKQL